jgi:hypothetical protein
LLIRKNLGVFCIILTLCAGLLHGLLYVFLVPPWQHNDEPNHFEYAWLAAHRKTLPTSADFDLDLSRTVVQSMVKHHFYDNLGYLPDLASENPVIIGGFSQLGDPPLYYLLASLPMRFLSLIAPNASIETQLYTTRLASLAFLLISLIAAWGLASELTGPSNPLRWLVPITLALWPGFIDLMTAVTNIAGGVAFFSLFLWFSVRLIRRGLGWMDLLGAIVTIAAWLYTLPGVYIVTPLLGIAVLFALSRKRLRWCAWGLLFSVLLAGLLAITTWGDADLWYRETWQAEPTRVDKQGVPLGKRAFQLVAPSQQPPARLYQMIPSTSVRRLEGKTVTLGAWMWATRPLEVNSPILKVNDGDRKYAGVFNVTETPAFHAITATLTGDISRAWVVLSLIGSKEYAGTDVFFDGVVLAEGSFPLDVPPNFKNSAGSRGMWGDHPFTNLVRNPSAEIAGLRIRLWADGRQLFGSHGRVSMVLYAIRDFPGAGWYFHGTAANMVRTLWGRFGWNHVPFLGHKPYRVFLVAMILGLAGALMGVLRKRRSVSWDLLVWLGLAVLIISGLAVTRGVFYLWFKPFIPSARYLYPVMPVIVFILCAGWWEVLRLSERWLPTWVRGLFYFILFFGLDAYALISIVSYYG